MIRLTKRERILAIALAILIGCWALFAFAVKPAIERTRTLLRVISDKQDELQQLRTGSNEYISLRNHLDKVRTQVASQDKGFELLPFLESLIREQGLSKKLGTMKQQVFQVGADHSETIVEIKLDCISF